MRYHDLLIEHSENKEEYVKNFENIRKFNNMEMLKTIPEKKGNQFQFGPNKIEEVTNRLSTRDIKQFESRRLTTLKDGSLVKKDTGPKKRTSQFLNLTGISKPKSKLGRKESLFTNMVDTYVNKNLGDNSDSDDDFEDMVTVLILHMSTYNINNEWG